MNILFLILCEKNRDIFLSGDDRLNEKLLSKQLSNTNILIFPIKGLYEI
jgi:hypothetical protein